MTDEFRTTKYHRNGLTGNDKELSPNKHLKKNQNFPERQRAALEPPGHPPGVCQSEDKPENELLTICKHST
jgi:hypothetical protein